MWIQKYRGNPKLSPVSCGLYHFSQQFVEAEVCWTVFESNLCDQSKMETILPPTHSALSLCTVTVMTVHSIASMFEHI